MAALRVSSAAESGAVIQSIFRGTAPIPASMVLANTAAAMLACERVTDLKNGVKLASDAIHSGAALRTLNHLIEWTRAQGQN